MYTEGMSKDDPNRVYALIDSETKQGLYRSDDLGWDPAEALRSLSRVQVSNDIDSMAASIIAQAIPGDKLVVMSNGGFGGLHGLLEAGLSARFRQDYRH